MFSSRTWSTLLWLPTSRVKASTRRTSSSAIAGLMFGGAGAGWSRTFVPLPATTLRGRPVGRPVGVKLERVARRVDGNANDVVEMIAEALHVLLTTTVVVLASAVSVS